MRLRWDIAVGVAGVAVGVVGVALSYLSLPSTLDSQRLRHLQTGVILLAVVTAATAVLVCWRAGVVHAALTRLGRLVGSRWRSIPRGRRAAVIGAVLIVLGTGTTGVPHARRLDRPTAGGAPRTAIPVGVTRWPLVAPSLNGSRSPAPAGAAGAPAPREVSGVELTVTRFGLWPGLRDHSLVTVNVAVRNLGQAPLDVAVRPRSPIRLLVLHSNGQWLPPGSPAVPGPVRVQLADGQFATAYPANSNGASSGVLDLFETDWTPTRLAPGSVYREVDESLGHLAFSVPNPSGRIIGLGYLDLDRSVPRLVTITPIAAWQNEIPTMPSSVALDQRR